MIKLRETTKNSIVASSYADTLGVPALFDRSLFQELLSLGDKAGAKSVIFRNRERVAEFVFPEGKIDIDTREDWQKLKEPGHPYHADAGEGSHADCAARLNSMKEFSVGELGSAATGPAHSMMEQ